MKLQACTLAQYKPLQRELAASQATAAHLWPTRAKKEEERPWGGSRTFWYDRAVIRLSRHCTDDFPLTSLCVDSCKQLRPNWTHLNAGEVFGTRVLIELGGFEALDLTSACNSPAALREAVSRNYTCVPTLFAFGLAALRNRHKTHTRALREVSQRQKCGRTGRLPALEERRISKAHSLGSA